MINIKSLKTILTLNFISVVTIPIVFISIITLYILNRNLQDEIVNKNIALSKSLVQEAEVFLHNQQSILGFVKNVVEGSDPTDRKRITHSLESLLSNYKFFDMIQIVDEMGVIQNMAPYREDYIGTNISGYPFFSISKKIREPYWSTIFISPQTGKPTIAVSRLVRNGMVVGYINLDQLGNIFDRFYTGTSGWVEVVDANGTFIYHTNKTLVEQQVNKKDDYIIKKGLMGDWGTFRFRQSGREIISNIEVISQTGWPVIASQSAREALAPLAVARNIFLGGALGALILAICFAIFNISKIMQPLASFAVWAKEIANGHYEISNHSNDFLEFNILAEDFIRMVQAVKLRENALRESEERYALAVLGAEDGLWDWNITENLFYYSPRWKEITGSDLHKVGKHPDEWFERIHPDDLKQFQKDLDNHLKGITTHFKNEHRLLHQEGSYRWVLARGIAIRNAENSQPFRMAGSITDISERKQAEERIQTSLKEKEILLKEIHHRVKNNMQIISSLLRLQCHYFEDQDVIQLFQDSQNRIRSMSLVHEKLYHSKDLAKIDFSDYLVNLVNSIFRSYTVNSNQIKLQIEVDNIRLGIDSAIPCGLIINELVTNSIKYAFPNNRQGQIMIKVNRKNKYGLKIIVKDDGVGIPGDIDITKSETLGLQLVTVLVKEQLQGELKILTENGTEFQITFREVKNG